MDKFEYKIVEDYYHDFEPESFLNEFGEDGWELVQVIKDPESFSGLKYQYYFKRKIVIDDKSNS